MNRSEAGRGIDYIELDQTAHFLEGTDTAYVAVLPLNDSFVEGPESVTLSIVDGSEYEVNPQFNAAWLEISDSLLPTLPGIADGIDPNTPQDITYLEASIVPDPLGGRLIVSTTLRDSSLLPAIEIYLDTDGNPLTGDYRQGHVHGAEYRIDASITFFEAQWQLIKLPTSDQEAAYYSERSCLLGIVCGSNLSDATEFAINRQPIKALFGETPLGSQVSVAVPLPWLQNPSAVDVFVLATTFGN
jgi:hypothetical protein